jgi:hypothetical protein
MRYSRAILDKNTGVGLSGYTMSIYTYSAVSPYYTTPKLYDMTDNGDGAYYAEITETIKGTIVVTTPSSTLVVPPNFIGCLIEGDNQPTL